MLEPGEEQRVMRSKLSSNIWKCAGTPAREAKLPDFFAALAVFIWENRHKAKESSGENQTNFRRESDPTWVVNYLVQIHGSVTAWKRTGNSTGNTDGLEKDHIICIPDWQKEKGWRRDHVWIQEHTAGSQNRNGVVYPWDGKMVGQLLLVFTVRDKGVRSIRGGHQYYTGAFIELLKWRNNGRVDPIHGMMEVEKWKINPASNPRKLNNRRVFLLLSIVQSAHMVSAGPNPTHWYINN